MTEEELIQKYLPLAKSEAKKHFTSIGQRGCLVDWVSDAQLGLLKAIRSHDNNRASLVTYIKNRIRTEMLNGGRSRDVLGRSHRRAVNSDQEEPVLVTSLNNLVLRSGEWVPLWSTLEAPQPHDTDFESLAGELDSDEIELLHLIYEKQNTQFEAAQILGVHRNTIRNRLRHIHDKLRTLGRETVLELLT